MMNNNKRHGPVIMGILNITPDSFSDGGQYMDIEAAVNHAKDMVREGASIIDIGGESTQPGSERISTEEQLNRVLEIVRNCREIIPDDIQISIDTTRSVVAEAAIDAGANIINDISAGRDDPEIIQLVAEKRLDYVLMHMLGTPETMQDDPCYDDVTLDVKQFLLERAEVAIKAGVSDDKIILDPGIGFGKTRDHNLQLLRELNDLVITGFPVLLGTSRKRFMGAICKDTNPENLVAATCATTTLGVMAGVKYFRVHDVKENRQAADIAWAISNQDKFS